jgi:hypothetical protein
MGVGVDEHSRWSLVVGRWGIGVGRRQKPLMADGR